jgi:transposase
MMIEDIALQKKYETILPHLNEQLARVYLGSEAVSLGRGGKQRVAKLAGVSRVRIDKGISELTSQSKVEQSNTSERIRKPGGGRKSHKEKQEGLLEALEGIVNPHTCGDPMKPLLWTSKSLRHIEAALKEKGYTVSYVTIGELLKTLGFSLQANRKTYEGGSVVDRNEQFEYINETAIAFMSAEEPVISVDCKKKELIGNFKNQGTEWHLRGDAPKVNVYDFIDKELGKAVPYGVYDIAQNQGWVSVGISKDTAEFAVNSIRSWWQQMGKEQYPNAKKILITADGGGSNGSRNRLWKKELQVFATETGLSVSVCHFPPGTSKWNKIEHRLFSHITKNWRAKPLISLEVVINLIANTSTRNGLIVKSQSDKKNYEKGIKVLDEDFKKIKIEKAKFRGDWNYSINP